MRFFKLASPLLFIAIVIGGCAAHSNIEPVRQGNLSGNVCIGGPIVNVSDTYFPIPIVTAGANYGLTKRIDLNGELNLLSLVYSIAGLDAGITWYPIAGDGAVPTWSLGIQPHIMALVSLKPDVGDRFRAYPMLSASFARIWCCGAVYTGFDLTIPISQSDYDDESPNFIWSPFIGYEWILTEDLRVFTEIKWEGANVRSNQLAADYLGISKYGAITPLFSIEKGFINEWK